MTIGTKNSCYDEVKMSDLTTTAVIKLSDVILKDFNRSTLLKLKELDQQQTSNNMPFPRCLRCATFLFL